MKLIFPNNLFTQLIIENLPQHLKNEVVLSPSSLILSEVKNYKSSIGLIPTLDLLKNKDLYVSKSFGLSFEGTLCNSYIYYDSPNKDISEITLHGDLSSVETILSKILFKEIYDTPIEIKIVMKEDDLVNQNHIVVGDKNFEDDRYLLGISFAEEIIETLSLPFVNYVFASTDKSSIEMLNEELTGLGNKIYDFVEVEKFEKKYSDKTKNYLKENIPSLIIEFDDQDLEGINQLIRLPYYHGIIDEIVEIRFV